MNNFKRTLFVNILNKALDTALIDKVILNNIFKVTLVTKLDVNTCIMMSFYILNVQIVDV